MWADQRSSMRHHPFLAAAILVASICAVAAEETRQPSPAPSTSTDSNYSDDTFQSILLSQDVQGALGKDVRSSSGEKLGRIVECWSIKVDRCALL
jgi:hypothetical protein